jgi:hypothetical protein
VWLIILWRGWWWKLMIHTSIWFYIHFFFFSFPVFQNLIEIRTDSCTTYGCHSITCTISISLCKREQDYPVRLRLYMMIQCSMLVNGSCFIVQLSHTLLNFQVPNIGAIMDNIPQITREGYFIRHLARKFLFSTSWLHSAYTC